MNNYKRLIWLIICLLSPLALLSQDLSFDKLSHNFGAIAESGGEVSCTFTFKNVSDTPVVIITANSSCGCTVPEYSRKPIAAGESSTIRVTYDPMDRPGEFSKTVQMIVAPGNKRYTMTISGDVTARQRTTAELYPFDFGGGLRLGANYYPLSHIEQGRRVESQIAYINESKRSIKVNLIAELTSGQLDIPSHLTIPAGQSGVITIAYDLKRHKGEYGPMSDKYALEVNGKRSEYDITIKAHAVDSFSDDELATPAICNIGDRVVRVGSVKRGSQSKPYVIAIENSGIRDLIIRDIDLGVGLSTNLKPGTIIAPSQQLKGEVWVDGKLIDYGSFSRYLTLTVNDPDAPVQRLRIIGTVEE